MPEVVFTLDRLEWSGSALYLSLLANSLAKKGWFVRVVTRKKGQTLDRIGNQNIKVYTVAERSLTSLYKCLRTDLLQSQGPCIVQSYDLPSHLWTRLSVSSKFKVPTLALYLDFPVKNRLFSRLLSYIHRNDAMVCTPFRLVADQIRRRGFDSSRLQLVPLASWDWPICTTDLDDLSRVCPLSKRCQLIVGIASYENNSQLKMLIWAMDILRYSNPDLGLVILGNGRAKASWEQFVRDLHLQDRVCLLANIWDFAKWLVQAELVWLCSDTPFVWLYAVTALALGKALLAVRSPIMAELITHNETGLLVPENDPVALARYSYWCLQTPELGKTLGAAARTYAAKNLDQNHLVRQYEEIYKQVLSHQG